MKKLHYQSSSLQLQNCSHANQLRSGFLSVMKKQAGIWVENLAQGRRKVGKSVEERQAVIQGLLMTSTLAKIWGGAA